MWGWGVMNQVAIKEAAAIGYPMDHFIGVWWSGSEADVIPAGTGAIGYKSSAFHAPGDNFPVHKDILKYVYKGDLAKAKENNFGEVLYNRMLLNQAYGLEAIRTAMKKYGNRPLKGSEVRWGFENMNLTQARIKELGMEGMNLPLHVTCVDHEVAAPVRIQQWDGKQWKFVSDWIPTIREVVRPMIEEAAATYAKSNNITPRKCT
jgi:branched-chain amino acid transport system substrate-binding protein